MRNRRLLATLLDRTWRIGILLLTALSLCAQTEPWMPVEPSSAPFDPETVLSKVAKREVRLPDDRAFIADQSSGAPTGCKYRSFNMTFDIPIKRYVGEVVDGKLAHAATMKARGLLSPKATLLIAARDVDTELPMPVDHTDQGLAPAVDIIPTEMDEVFLNGKRLGWLDGKPDKHSVTAFEIDIEHLRFPEKGSNGNPPEGAMNELRIDIDTEDVAPPFELWCVEIEWAALMFKTVSPIILVHGTNADSTSFDHHEFSHALNDALWPVDGCGQCDNPINLQPNNARISTSAGFLKTLIPETVRRFGVDSVHLIGHSKGGLDIREYLAKYQRGWNDQFKVLTYTSLSSPHNGTVLADIKVAWSERIGLLHHVEFPGFPLMTQALAAFGPPGPANEDQRTSAMAEFNVKNVPKLSRKVVYRTVGADADLNSSGTMDISPEWIPLLPVSWLTPAAIPNTMYQILRNVKTIEIEPPKRRSIGLPGFSVPSLVTVTVIKAVPTRAPQQNDLIVTVPSALGTGSLDPLQPRPPIIRVGDVAKNHSNLVNRGVALDVLLRIKNDERGQGDLK